MKLLSVLILTFISFPIMTNAQSNSTTDVTQKLISLEKETDSKIVVYALNTNNKKAIAYRENEHFPIQSTFKIIAVSDLLNEAVKDKNLLQQKIHFEKEDLVFWHPVSGKYVSQGMTLEQLSQAVISYSDDTAINLIMKKLGGPQAINNFAHSIGNKSFNIVNYEVALNSNPNKLEDSSTPKDMALSTQKLLLGNILSAKYREKLITWMKDSTTGYKRIRAGVPMGWVVAEKSGSGEYGVANDVGIMWSPLCKPVILAIYTVLSQKNAKKRDDVLAAITTMVFEEFAKNDKCFAELNK